MSRMLVTKLARSLLFFTPAVYRLAHSQLRAEVRHRLRVPHERDFRALARLYPGARPLVLDVGANIGQSVYSIKAVLPGARVVSFEPHPDTAARLRRVETRFADVRVEACGLGAVEAEVELYTPIYRSKRMPALASTDRDAAAGWLSPGTVFWFNPGRLRVESSAVSIRTLDSFNLDPDFIKLDVQGAEAAVIAGGLETIHRSQPVIMAEAPGDDVHRQLRDAGYREFAFDGHRWGPPRQGLNSFFLPAGMP